MKTKKSPKKDLESKKLIFAQIGLIIALGLVLVAFEWKSYDKKEIEVWKRKVSEIPMDIIQITEQKDKPLPVLQKQVTALNIVDDEDEIEDDTIEIDAGADQNTEIEEYVPVDIEEEEDFDDDEIFVGVESQPSFPGGDIARIRFLYENIQYPAMAKETGIQGRVYITFVVERDGSITDVRLLKGIGGGCDEESIRVVKAMPKWIPGKQRERPVRVQFILPIKFTLR